MTAVGGLTPKRRRLVIAAAVVIVAAVVVVVTFLAASGSESYATFRRQCLAVDGSSVITLSTTRRDLAMGAPETDDHLGCRGPNGTITSRFTLSRQ